MIGILFATQREADPFVNRICAKPMVTGPFTGYHGGDTRYESCVTVISGMGKVAAAVAAMHLVLHHRVSILVNAGLCGSLNIENKWSTGDLFRIHRAIEGDCDRFGKEEKAVFCDTSWFRYLNTARLVTCDRPVFKTADRIQLAGLGDLVDMEGTAVARVAAYYGIACLMLKGISDGANEKGRVDIAKNLNWVSDRIASAVANELPKIDEKKIK